MTLEVRNTLALPPATGSRHASEGTPATGDLHAALVRSAVLAAYHRWILDLITPELGTRILDAGCGVGSVTRLLLERAEYVLAVDQCQRSIDVLRSVAGTGAALDTLCCDLERLPIANLTPAGIDTIVCLDVLEHVRDDVALLRHLRAGVPPGGRLILKVPAWPWLFGPVDVASGHYRRYSRGSLRRSVEEAGWSVRMIRSMNLAGIIPYWLKCKVLRRRQPFSRTLSDGSLRRINAGISWIRMIDRLLGPPVGLSLILTAERPCAATWEQS